MTNKLMTDTVADLFTKKYLKQQSSELNENLSNFLMGSLQTLRNEDYFTYEQLNMLTNRQQMDILEGRLELELMNIPVISKALVETTEYTFEKVIKDNPDLIDEPKMLMEAFDKEYSTNVFPLLEDNVLSKALHTLGDVVSHPGQSIKNLVKGFFKYFPSLAGAGVAIYPLMGGGILASLSTLIILIAGTYAANRVISPDIIKNQLEMFNGIADFLSQLSKDVKDGTEGIKYRYEITFKNEEKCYQRAGLDPKKLGLRAFFAAKDKSVFREILFFDDEKKLDEARTCFLESFLDRISIFFDLYFDCLKKSGNWNSVKDLSDDKYIAMFRMKGGMYPVCDEYRNNAVEAIKKFEGLIDFIFEKSPEKKSRWMLLLNRYILDTRTSKDQLKKENRDFERNVNHKPFKNEKYNKYTKDI